MQDLGIGYQHIVGRLGGRPAVDRVILRTLHADHGLSGMAFDWPSFNLGQNLLDSLSNKLVQLATERIAKHRMSNNANASEKGVLPDSLGPVDDLIWNDEIPRCDIFS